MGCLAVVSTMILEIARLPLFDRVPTIQPCLSSVLKPQVIRILHGHDTNPFSAHFLLTIACALTGAAPTILESKVNNRTRPLPPVTVYAPRKRHRLCTTLLNNTCRRAHTHRESRGCTEAWAPTSSRRSRRSPSATPSSRRRGRNCRPWCPETGVAVAPTAEYSWGVKPPQAGSSTDPTAAQHDVFLRCF